MQVRFLVPITWWITLVVTNLPLVSHGNSEVIAWGYNNAGQTNVPSNLSNVVAIAAGSYHSLALTAEGRVVAWGDNSKGQTTVPSFLSNVVAIAAGSYHSLALTAEGRVVAWGDNSWGQTNIPAGLNTVTAIAVREMNSMALTDKGQVVTWGQKTGEVPADLSNVVAIAAGGAESEFALALTEKGQVIAWGNNVNGQATVPGGLSNVVAISAGGEHSLALTSDGHVVGWGLNNSGLAMVPAGLSNVVAIAAGTGHSVALTAQGNVVEWGANTTSDPVAVRALRNVVAIAAGYNCTMVLTAQSRIMTWTRGAPPIELTGLPSDSIAVATGNNFSMALSAEGKVKTWGDGFQPDVSPAITNIVSISATGGIDNFGWYGNHVLELTEEGQVLGGARYEDVGLHSWTIDPPTGLSNVAAISAGGRIGLALVELPPGLVAPEWIGPRFLVGTVGYPFYHRITAKNGVTRYSAVGLPPGLVLNPTTGLIMGQPTQLGTYSVALSATNQMGSCSWTVTLFINDSNVPQIASGGVVQARFGNDFSFRAIATANPEWFGANGLPVGLGIDTKTGLITGVPTEFGDFVVSLVVSNHYGQDTGSLTVRVPPVVAWGNNESGRTNMPGGLTNVVAIAAGYSHTLMLRDDGTVVGWPGVATDLSNVVAIAVGAYHCLALTRDGRVIACGNNSMGQATVPTGLTSVVAIDGGNNHSLALTAEGKVIWLGCQ